MTSTVHRLIRAAIGMGVLALVAAGCASTSTGTDQQTRNYFIEAEEVAWNYAPSGNNVYTGAAFDDAANKFVKAGPDRIGSARPTPSASTTATPTRASPTRSRARPRSSTWGCSGR